MQPYAMNTLAAAILLLGIYYTGHDQQAAAQQTTKVADIGQWQLWCGDANTTATCYVQQTQGKTMADGQIVRVASALIRRILVDEQPRWLVQMTLPLGFHIPAGVGMRIGETAEQSMTVQSCDNNGCVAAGLLSTEATVQIGFADVLVVGFRPQAESDPMVVNFPLEGLTDGLQKLAQ